jgi:hypothetical protein
VKAKYGGLEVSDAQQVTTASPPACQRFNPRRRATALPSSYTTTRDTTVPKPVRRELRGLDREGE